MQIPGLLESAIGLVLIYLVPSLICSAWVEVVVNRTGLRGENLHKMIEVQCGSDEQIANLLLVQPELRALYAPTQSISRVGHLVRRGLALCFDRGESQRNCGFCPPSYIPPGRFARALSELALGDSVERLRNTPDDNRPEKDANHISKVLTRLWYQAGSGQSHVPKLVHRRATYCCLNWREVDEQTYSILHTRHGRT